MFHGGKTVSKRNTVQQAYVTTQVLPKTEPPNNQQYRRAVTYKTCKCLATKTFHQGQFHHTE